MCVSIFSAMFVPNSSLSYQHLVSLHELSSVYVIFVLCEPKPGMVFQILVIFPNIKCHEYLVYNSVFFMCTDEWTQRF
jgi:hypothetical protein